MDIQNMMFGQITGLKDKTSLEEFVDKINHSHNFKCTPKGIKYRSERQNYILPKEIIIPDNSRITRLAKEYVNENLSSEIKISDICEYADTSRTKLYEAFKSDCNMGVAEYIRKKRLEYACSMLKSGELSVAEVSAKTGFHFERINVCQSLPHRPFPSKNGCINSNS